MIDGDPPLSPELVLVSPELREQALRIEQAVPARWETTRALPPARPSTSSPPEGQLSPAGRGRIDLRRRVGYGALAAVVVFSAGIAVSRVASLGSAAPTPTTSARAGGFKTTGPPAAATEPAPSHGVVANKRTRSSATLSAKRGQLQPSASVAPTTSTTRAGAAKPAAVRAIPLAGYVLGAGSFRTAADASRILGFSLRTRCGGALTLPSIQIDAFGAFAFSGHPAGSLPKTSIRVVGRFVSPREARGTIATSRPGCRGAPTAFVARLS